MPRAKKDPGLPNKKSTRKPRTKAEVIETVDNRCRKCNKILPEGFILSPIDSKKACSPACSN